MDSEENTFTYVMIPADSSKPIEERTESAEGGLEDDRLIKTLKAGTEIGPMVDIVALTVPTVKTNYVAVSIYQNGNPGRDKLPVNKRIMGLMEACGLKSTDETRGDVFVSRYMDNDDDIWKRIDFKIEDCTSDSAWVKESLNLNKGRNVSGSSLSSILAQQANQANLNSGAPVTSSSSGDFQNDSKAIWTQTPDEIEAVSPIAEGVTKRDVKVKFAQERLEVTIKGEPDRNLTGTLGGATDVDGCTWNFDGNGNIVVSLEKKQSGTQWPFALKQD